MTAAAFPPVQTLMRRAAPADVPTIAAWHPISEDEVELARLIVAPQLRGLGHGKRLVRVLVEKAAATGLTTTMLRVMPNNHVAINCYLVCGLQRLGPEESAEWNQGQRLDWVWSRVPSA